MFYRPASVRAAVRVDLSVPRAGMTRSLLALACACPALAAAQANARDPVDLDRLQITAHRGAATEGNDSYTADVARSSTKLELSLRDGTAVQVIGQPDRNSATPKTRHSR